MLINFNQLKTFYNALVQKMKGFRGNWNQNDASADDYIKGRTHWVETGETVVLPLTNLTSTEVELQHPLVEGETYHIIWDGIEYESIARNYDGWLMLGNNAIYDYDNGIETDTGEPFALETEGSEKQAHIYLPPRPREAIADDDYAQHTICITSYGEIVHKLDKKFIDIPDGLVTEEEVLNLMDEELAPVAWTNNYNSLSGRPSIPTEFIRYDIKQVLSESQKSTARENMGVNNKMDANNPAGTGSFSLNRKANTVIGNDSVAEGGNTTASGRTSHAEGTYTIASGTASHAEGGNTTASGAASHAEGYSTTASGYGSHAEGYDTTASGQYASHAEGGNTTASGDYSHTEGNFTTASGEHSHAEGSYTMASGKASHAEGNAKYATVTLTGDANATTYSYLEDGSDPIIGDRIKSGDSIIFITAVDKDNHTCTVSSTLSSSAITNQSFAFCRQGLASGDYSHAEGSYTMASGRASHAEGYYTTASGGDSHAEGSYTTASENSSHAEGHKTTASGSYSHAEGSYTIAASNHQHVQGTYNIEDSSNKYLHIVGNGKTNSSRSNAHTLDRNGLGWFQGGLKIGGTNQDDINAKEIATQEYVNNATAQKSQVQIITWGADD